MSVYPAARGLRMRRIKSSGHSSDCLGIYGYLKKDFYLSKMKDLYLCLKRSYSVIHVQTSLHHAQPQAILHLLNAFLSCGTTFKSSIFILRRWCMDMEVPRLRALTINLGLVLCLVVLIS